MSDTSTVPTDATGGGVTAAADAILSGTDEYDDLLDNSDALTPAEKMYETEADAMDALLSDEPPDGLGDVSAGGQPAASADEVEMVQWEMDGQPVEVPLDELTGNYQLRAALDAREAQLQQQMVELQTNAESVARTQRFTAALDQNPVGVLMSLADQMGVRQQMAAQLGVQQAPPQQSQSFDDPYSYGDPQPQQAPAGGDQPPVWAQGFMQQFAQMNQRFEALENHASQTVAAQRDAAHRAEFDTYETEYPRHGVTYDEVSAHWQQGQFPSLRAAFHDLALPRIQERQRIAASQNQQRRQRARGAAPMARSGQHGSRGEQTVADEGAAMPRAKTVAEAMEWASGELLRQHGA